MTLTIEFDTDDIPKDFNREALLKWSNELGVKALQVWRDEVELDLAKVRVAIDAVKRGKEEEIPPSVREFLNSIKPPVVDVHDLPTIIYT